MTTPALFTWMKVSIAFSAICAGFAVVVAVQLVFTPRYRYQRRTPRKRLLERLK